MTENGNMIMPVSPIYGGGGMGGFGGWGSDAWLILILLFACGGFGGMGWGGMGFGGFGGMYEFPWLLNGQNQINANTNAGFDHAATQTAIAGLQNSVTSGFGDVQTALCGGFAGVNATVSNGFAQAEIANNSRQIANMQQAFNSQTAITGAINNLSAQQANCCCENRLQVAQLGSDIAREACADRQAVNDGVRDILANQTAGIQRILDKLCDQELLAERRTNDQLRQQLNMANLQASQVAQTAELRQSGATQLNQLVSELRSCPIPAQPVYGSTPIFSCNNNSCGCGNF